MAVDVCNGSTFGTVPQIGEAYYRTEPQCGDSNHGAVKCLTGSVKIKFQSGGSWYPTLATKTIASRGWGTQGRAGLQTIENKCNHTRRVTDGSTPNSVKNLSETSYGTSLMCAMLWGVDQMGRVRSMNSSRLSTLPDPKGPIQITSGSRSRCLSALRTTGCRPNHET
jgi:hypothetical protein